MSCSGSYLSLQLGGGWQHEAHESWGLVRWTVRRALSAAPSTRSPSRRLLRIQQWLWPAPLGVVVQGVVIGGLTSLLAFGLALTYRSNRIINFATGDLGGAPAALGVLLIVGPGLPYFVAMPIALAGRGRARRAGRVALHPPLLQRAAPHPYRRHHRHRGPARRRRGDPAEGVRHSGAAAIVPVAVRLLVRDQPGHLPRQRHHRHARGAAGHRRARRLLPLHAHRHRRARQRRERRTGVAARRAGQAPADDRVGGVDRARHSRHPAARRHRRTPARLVGRPRHPAPRAGRGRHRPHGEAADDLRRVGRARCPRAVDRVQHWPGRLRRPDPLHRRARRAARAAPQWRVAPRRRAAVVVAGGQSGAADPP